MNRHFWLGLFLVSLLGLAACNTVEGFGEDLQKVGDEMSDAARDEQND